MEALEQAYKYQVTVDRLEGIPAFGKIAMMVEKSAKNKIDKKRATIENAIAAEEGDLNGKATGVQGESIKEEV